MLKTSQPILLVESNQTDQVNIKNALFAIDEKCTLVCSNSSEEALTYLREPDKSRPWLILLGMNANDSDGFSFLKTVKTDEHLRKIPVVVISESGDGKNLEKGFNHGIAGFMIKHRDVSKVSGTIEAIMRYWSLSKLPLSGV